MTARQVSRGPIESAENSCHPKTDLCVTAKVLINTKNIKRSGFSKQTKPLVSHQRTVHPSSTTRNSGGTCRTFRLNRSPVWAKMKMRLNPNGQICRAMHLKRQWECSCFTEEIYVTGGKGWAFQSSSLRNFSPPECLITPRITEPASLPPSYEASRYDRQPVASKHCLACLNYLCIFICANNAESES